MPRGEIAFTSVLITIVVTGYVLEPELMNKGMFERIDQLFNLQEWEVPTREYLKLLQRHGLKKAWPNHWY